VSRVPQPAGLAPVPSPADTLARARRLLGLALPVMAGMASQNVVSLVDTAMVSRLGAPSLAAVGVASFANLMAVSLVIGLAAGVQAMVARRHGEGDTARTAVPLNGGLVLALALGIPLSAVLFVLVPVVFPWLNADPAVIANGVPYLQARVVGVAAVGMNFAFRGYWIGINRSRLYLRTLLMMHATNIALDWVLIYGHLGAPALGTLGAGIASTAAVALGTVEYGMLALRWARERGFLAALPRRPELARMLAVSLPASVQQLTFATGFTTLFWIVGRVGTEEVAVANVLVNVMLVAILPGTGLGLAAGALVGQALGRHDFPDARRWGWNAAAVGVAFVSVLILPMVIVPDPILGVFLADPATLAMARLPLRLAAVTLAIDAAGTSLFNGFLGAGDTRRVLAVSVAMQWGLFLPAAWIVGPVLGYGLLGIWIALCAWRLLMTATLATLWEHGAWARIRL
jgi:MATE family multidrug resistance protein